MGTVVHQPQSIDKGSESVQSSVVGITTDRWLQVSAPTVSGNHKERMYRCSRCGKIIRGSLLLVHTKAEEYIIELLKRDHPEWVDHNGACSHCEQYYQALVERAGI